MGCCKIWRAETFDVNNGVNFWREIGRENGVDFGVKWCEFGREFGVYIGVDGGVNLF